MKINMIMACDLNHGIGYQNSLPWPRDVEDMRMFKRRTTGNGNNAILMGYKTWDSLPESRRPLPERMNIVLTRKSRSTYEPNLCFLKSLDDIKWLLDDSWSVYDELWIIGGKTVYEQAIHSLPISEILLTTFKRCYNCDVFCDIKKLLDEAKIQYDAKFIYENDTRKVEMLEVKQRTIG